LNQFYFKRQYAGRTTKFATVKSLRFSELILRILLFEFRFTRKVTLTIFTPVDFRPSAMAHVPEGTVMVQCKWTVTSGFRTCCVSLDIPAPRVTPVAGLIFETKNRAIFLERIFGRGITAREQLSRAVILARF